MPIRREPENGSPTWRVVAASVQGVTHVRTALPCQDAHCWELMGECLLTAVADGAGSAQYAEVGASLAAQTAIEMLLAELPKRLPTQEYEWEACLQAVLMRTRQALFQEAERRQVAVRELASTLLILVVTPWGVAAAQIGDGGIVLSNANCEMVALTRPAQGEHANETTFLISPDALSQAQIIYRPEPATYFAVFSDGLQRLALHMAEGTPHAPFFSPLFRFVDAEADVVARHSQLTDFLRAPRIMERTDDDLTLLLASYRER